MYIYCWKPLVLILRWHSYGTTKQLNGSRFSSSFSVQGEMGTISKEKIALQPIIHRALSLCVFCIRMPAYKICIWSCLFKHRCINMGVEEWKMYRMATTMILFLTLKLLAQVKSKWEIQWALMKYFHLLICFIKPMSISLKLSYTSRLKPCCKPEVWDCYNKQ